MCVCGGGGGVDDDDGVPRFQVVGNESMAGEELMEDPETEEALAEFDFLVTESGEGAGEARSHDGSDWGKPHCHAALTPSSLLPRQRPVSPPQPPNPPVRPSLFSPVGQPRS